MLIFFILSLLIAVLAVVFALQNTMTVPVAFLVWNTQGSLALILLIAFIAGLLVAFFASLPSQFRDKWRLRGHRKRLNELEASLAVQKQKLSEAERKLAEKEPPFPIERFQAPETPGQPQEPPEQKGTNP